MLKTVKGPTFWDFYFEKNCIFDMHYEKRYIFFSIGSNGTGPSQAYRKNSHEYFRSRNNAKK